MKMFQTILELIKNVINTGVTEDMPFSEKRSLRALNLVGVLGCPFPAILSSLVWTLLGTEYYVFVAGLITSLILGSMPLFSFNNKRSLGIFVLYITLFTNLVIDEISLGGVKGLELGAFFMLVGAFSFSTTSTEAYAYSVLAACSVLTCIFLFHWLKPVFEMSSFIIHFLFGLTSLAFSSICLNMIKSQNDSYEMTIEQKNIELEKSKIELTYQHDNLVKLNLAIREKNEKLGHKNYMITESLNYARRIQFSTLPDMAEVQKHMGECFIFYKPKDIVSGDFYWITRQNGTLYFAVADCTGHGVPGAFMSLMGSNFLHQIIREPGEKKPSEILNLLSSRINQQLGHNLLDEYSREGMDITLCSLNSESNTLMFSSAGRPLFLLKQGKVIDYKGTRG